MHIYYTFPFLALGLMILAQHHPNLATFSAIIGAAVYSYYADRRTS